MNDVRNYLPEAFPGRRLISLVIAGAMGLASPSLAEAAEIKVPGGVATIQQAIDAASAGDTVRVAPGTYFENINFHGKAITVESEQGPQLTIIDGRRLDSVAKFYSGETRASVLSGFTLSDGDPGFSFPSFGSGGGISIGHSSPTITNNVITNNRACVGPGISSSFGSPLIQENLITGNFQFGCSGGIGGGGISIGGNSAAEIIDNEISNNVLSSADGAGISLFAAGTPTIRGNVISDNIATGVIPCTHGGGISLVNFSNALIVQNLIVRNRAGCGGGIYVSSPVLGLVNNTIADNDGAPTSGIYVSFTTGPMINNIIRSATGQTAIFCAFGNLNPGALMSNNVFSPQGITYGGFCTDQTGLNGNISADPVFVDPLAGNYRLQTGSPSVDTGNNAALGLPAADLDGDPRICNGVVDMGAYELCFLKIESLGPAAVWLGLKNSDDAGLRVDVLAQVFLTVGNTTTKIGEGQLNDKLIGSSGFANAVLGSITLALTQSVLAEGELELKLSVRRACSGAGHQSGTARLWYNGQPVDTGPGRDAGSRLAVAIGANTSNFFLRDGAALSSIAGASRLFVDRFLDSTVACPNRPFTPFGAWGIDLSEGS